MQAATTLDKPLIDIVFASLPVQSLCAISSCCKEVGALLSKAEIERKTKAKEVWKESVKVVLTEERRLQILKGLTDGGGFTDSEHGDHGDPDAARSEYSGVDHSGDFSPSSSSTATVVCPWA